jgi:hypothetical protein
MPRSWSPRRSDKAEIWVVLHPILERPICAFHSLVGWLEKRGRGGDHLKPVAFSAKLRPWRWLKNTAHPAEEDGSLVFLKKMTHLDQKLNIQVYPNRR